MTSTAGLLSKGSALAKPWPSLLVPHTLLLLTSRCQCLYWDGQLKDHLAGFLNHLHHLSVLCHNLVTLQAQLLHVDSLFT